MARPCKTYLPGTLFFLLFFVGYFSVRPLALLLFHVRIIAHLWGSIQVRGLYRNAKLPGWGNILPFSKRYQDVELTVNGRWWHWILYSLWYPGIEKVLILKSIFGRLRLGLSIPEELFTSRGTDCRRAYSNIKIHAAQNRPKPKVFVLWSSLLAHEPQMEPWLQMNKYSLELEVQARHSSRKVLYRNKQFVLYWCDQTNHT